MKKVILFSLAFLLPNFILLAQNNDYWTFYKYSDFLPNNTVNQVTTKGDSLIFATNNGVTIKHNNTYTTMAPPYNLLANPVVNKVCAGDDGSMFFYHENTGQITYLSNGSYQVFQDSLDGFGLLNTQFEVKHNNGLYYFNSAFGFQVFDGNTFKVIDSTIFARGFAISNDTIFGCSFASGLIIHDSTVIDSFDYILPNGVLVGNNNMIGLNSSDLFTKFNSGTFDDTLALNLGDRLADFNNNGSYQSYLDSQNSLWIYIGGILVRSDFSKAEITLDLSYERSQTYGYTFIKEYNNKIIMNVDSGWYEAPLDIAFVPESTLDINELNLTLSPNSIVYQPIIPDVENQYDGRNILFSSTLAWSGINSYTNEHKASQDRFYYLPNMNMNENQIFPGPIRNNHSTYLRHRTWKVNAVDVQNHIANYANSNYQIPESILNWPAHGRTSVGEATCLAPFVDLNNNGLYEPFLGDYPQIKGDQAVYAISNDEHATDGHIGFGIEQHTMMYAYNSIDGLEKTVFLNYRLVNRSSTTYDNFKIGNFTDFNLGNAEDDYVGSDSTRNLFYVYNGDNFDEDGGGSTGFGANPPAAGVVFLSDSLDGFVYHTNSLSIYGEPITDSRLYQLMNEMWYDGSPRGYSYMFNGDPVTGNGFTEANTGNQPYDRRGWGFVESRTFSPGDTMEFEMAIILALNSGINSVDAITDLRHATDTVNQWYQNQTFDAWNFNCIDAHVSVDDMASNEQNQIKLYPNPTNDLLIIDGIDEQTEVSVYNISGQLVHREFISGLSQLNVADYAKGMYILSVQNEHLYETHRWIKQ